MTLCTFSDQVLTRLLAEEEDKVSDLKESESLVKLFNAIMLRVLENGKPNDVYSVLFELLMKFRRSATYSKMVGLVIKCILKLTRGLESFLANQQLAPENLLIKSHLYLIEFFQDPAKNNEDIGVKTIKTILNELGKHLGEKIWDSYKLIQQHNNTPDHHLHRWISIILKPTANSAILSPNSNHPNVPPAANIK